MHAALKKPNVHIKDVDHVMSVINNMVNGGSDHLQVIADFDMTLTRFKDDDGKPCASCYCALEVSPFLPSSYREKALALKNHYYQIEIDPHMTVEQKCPFMVEWWTKAHELLLECHFKKSFVEQIVKDSQILLRKGCDWLFQELKKHDVPLLIFSAGIGDVLVEAVKQRSAMYDNIRVVSNFMDFDEQGVIKGFKGELLHVFNKNENAVHKSDYFESLSHRHNIILMGDSLGDLQMAQGAAECANILTIGFLNEKVSERLPSYVAAFDIVLVSDETMEIPNAIIKQILYNVTETSPLNHVPSAGSS